MYPAVGGGWSWYSGCSWGWSGVGWGWYSGCSWGWSGGVYTEVGVGTQGAVGGRVVEYTLKVGLVLDTWSIYNIKTV